MASRMTNSRMAAPLREARAWTRALFLALHVEADEFVLRRRPVRAELNRLLIVEIGGLGVLEAFVGDRTVEIDLGRLLDAQLQALVQVRQAFGVAVFTDRDGAAVDIGLAHVRLDL